MSFHETLRKVRLERGLKQKEVAAAIGVSEPTYSMYEKGAREPSASKLRDIALTLDVSADRLLECRPASPPPHAAARPAVLEMFPEKHLRELDQIFSMPYLIPPDLLLQIIKLYINQSTSVRADVVKLMLNSYSPSAAALANLPQPDLARIRRALQLILNYIEIGDS